MSFQNFNLNDTVVHGAQRMGYVEPTPIQLEAIPKILQRQDLIASAQTGTGKTAAFALPILSLLNAPTGRTRCLILEPTRELAMQVEEALKEFSFFTALRAAVLFGGVGYGVQKEALQNGVDIIVATPGRLLDLIEQGEATLKDIDILVLDEVDRMLDMGFLPDVRRIVQQCPKERLTLLFSATIPEEIERLSSWCLNNPEKINIGIRRSAAESVTHAFYPVAAAQKFDLLLTLLEQTDFHSVLIFCRTKDGADRIARQLLSQKHTVAVLHSNRSQQERIEALEGFKSGRYEVMVATDIAARGIDIAGVSHVINFDVPQHPEDYVHRIGRTGRAQTIGDAFTIMTVEDLLHVKAIEAFIASKVPRLKLENFPYFFTTLFQEENAEKILRNVRGARTLKGYSYGARKRK
ncbi:MAG: RNA helicase [Verrucomicrobia bacterium RIFCSPHIGHO2_12_FULL_41_10]|nr:MAG: RNA helicase [Verrucomicrobia bacterium RIFCSPHIGHO2_12_FULL_41_10]HLB34261.1 DEAD/DEAH box helicase [Chthoniobacterales bacterium]